MTGPIVILMCGGNVWGRILAARLAPLRPLVINETGTRRAERLAGWLAPDYGPPLGEHVAVCDLFAEMPDCDYALNGGVGAILRAPVLSRPRRGFVNAHPGLLPEYRGIDPVCWALEHGDPQGATVHFMDEGIDTGPILVRREMPSSTARDIVSLRLEVLEFAAALTAEFLSDPNSFPPKPQDPSAGASFGAFDRPERLNARLVSAHAAPSA